MARTRISNQWETIKTIREYTTHKGARRALMKQNKNLKHCYLVCCADDFKIFCRDYPSTLRLYHATQDFIERRLKLEISPEKSKIVNLRKEWSEFLGFTMYVRPKRNGYIAYSHMSDKAIRNAQDKLKQFIKRIAKEQSRDAVWKYSTGGFISRRECKRFPVLELVWIRSTGILVRRSVRIY